MKQFKKVLAFVLALAMVVTAVPTADAKAAAKQPKLNNTKKILYVGQSYTLKIGNLPANWKKCTYAWSASNKNVTVKKGKYGQAASVKANKAGTATVTVKMTYPQTAAQKKAKKKTVKTFKCAVTVKNPSVKFTTTADRIEVGETAQFTAKATPSTAKVTYSSSDAAVATVDATGLVTAVADGTATIKASAKVGTKTVTATKSVEVYTAPTEAKQTKVKEITITSGKVVTKDSKIEVKKGSVEVAIAEKKDKTKDIAIDATGKTVVITTAAKLTKGDYTVTIDGVTANFSAEDEKVAKIEFTGDKAVLDAQKCSVDSCAINNGSTSHTSDSKTHKMIYKTATVGYKVYNQFGEDVTDATPVKVSGSDVLSETPAKRGTVVFTSRSLDGYRLNDIVAAVVIYNNNSGVAVTQSGTFTVSNESAISELAIKDGVYNKKGEAVTITEDTDLNKDKYYVLVSAKDQYGNAKTSLKHDVNVLVQMAGGLTYLTLGGANPQSEEITVDGVKYAGFRLRNSDKIGAGTATLIIISKGTGKTAQGTITVANGAKVDTITVNVPDLIVADESNKLGYTALDAYGKEVTKLDSLLDVTNILTEDQAKAAGKGIYAKENPATGKAELYYLAKSKPAVAGFDPTAVTDYDTISLITKTYKTAAVNFSIKPNAQPTAITGTKDLTTGATEGQQFVITKENIKVADQYGRTDKLALANYEIFAYFPDGADSNKSFSTASPASGLFGRNTDKNGQDIQHAADLTAKDNDATPIEARHKADAVVITSDNEKEVTTKVRFVLAPASTDVSTLDLNKSNIVLSTFDVTFTSSTKANVTSYNVKDLGTVYAGDLAAAGTWDVDFDVKGTTSEGAEVKIDAADYTVTVDSKVAAKLNGMAFDGGTLDTVVLTGAGDLLEKDETAKVTLRFTFKDGKTLDKEVTFSKEAPEVKSVEFRDGKEYFTAAAGLAVNYDDSLVGSIKAKDQYGKEVEGALPVRVTFSNLSDANVGGLDRDAIDDNGTEDAEITAGKWSIGDTMEVKLTFQGGFEFTGKVVAGDAGLTAATVGSISANTYTYDQLVAKISASSYGTSSTDSGAVAKASLVSITLTKSGASTSTTIKPGTTGIEIESGDKVTYTFTNSVKEDVTAS